jgi:hypothetical protein
MKQQALAVFRQPPERLNCAQAVMHAWREVTGDTTLALADLKALGGGRAPAGICGALHAACLAAPGQTARLQAAFADCLGSIYCRELRAAKQHPCETCVAHAAELLASGAAPGPKGEPSKPAAVRMEPKAGLQPGHET